MANKRKRKQKISGGTGVGSRSVKLTELQKVLLGKGMIETFIAKTPKREKRDKSDTRA